MCSTLVSLLIRLTFPCDGSKPVRSARTRMALACTCFCIEEGRSQTKPFAYPLGNYGRVRFYSGFSVARAALRAS